MRLILKWLSQGGLLVIAASLSGDWSLVDALHLMDKNGSLHILGITLNGQKSHIELGLRFGLSVCALALVAATDVLDVVLPRRQVRDLRDGYLKLRATAWRTELTASDIRISIWYLVREATVVLAALESVQVGVE